ncbi:MAG: HEAT repeat domain-containing protein, partial [Cyanobacteria bacterium J06635_10]
AIQVTQLALEIDLRLGARLAGATSKSLQKKTIKLLLEKDCQDSLKIWLLQQARSSETIPFLLNSLQNGDSNHRWRAARALAKFDKHLVKDHLVQSLNDKDASVRRIAALSLKELCSDDVAIHLCRLLNNDEDWLVRSFVVDYLGDLQGKNAIECLKQALNHQDSMVRNKAAEHLGRHIPQQVVSILEKRLEEDSESKKIAIKLLAETGSSLAFPLLMRALSDDDWIVRSNTVDSIGFLGTRLGMQLPDKVVDKLLDVLQNDTNPSVRSGAALHLGFSKAPKALPLLIQAVSKDNHRVVRYSAVVALGEIQDLIAT